MNNVAEIDKTELEVAADKERALVPVDESAAMLQMIERVATDPNADVDKMQKLLDMKLQIMGIENEQAFNQAMTAAQTEIRPISADAENPQTRSKYASYAQLDKSLRPIYTRHGFSCSFNGGEGAPENMVRVYLYVAHNSGHTRTYQTDMPADGKGAKGNAVMTATHAMGAGFTYGQRYLLKLAFNVAIGEDDTDGNVPDKIIDADKLAILQKKVDETEGDAPKMCAFFKVQSLAELTESDYYRAIGMLVAKDMHK